MVPNRSKNMRPSAIASVVADRRAETSKVSDRTAHPDAQENLTFNRLIGQDYVQ
jgi:hypothetical protein